MGSRGVADEYLSPAAELPFSQYNSISQASGTVPAAVCIGCMENVLLSSGATALTLPPAAALFNALSINGLQYRLRIINTNGGTLTLTAGAGCTVTGTLTLATNTWREFDVTVSGPPSSPTAKWNNIGTGTYS